jgi:hypothetical protein
MDIVSIHRLQSLVNFANTMNSTWDLWDLLNWSISEIYIGVMCAWMPTFHLVFVRLCPKVFGSSNETSQSCDSEQRYECKSSGSNREANNSSGTSSQLDSHQGGASNNEFKVITIGKTFGVERFTNTGEGVLILMANAARVELNANNTKRTL